MNRIRPLIFVFLIAGLCSGIFSGLSVIVAPLGLIVPGIFFGLALAFAFNASVMPLKTLQWAAIIGGPTGGYIVAMFACGLSAQLPGFDNGILSGTYAGAIAGGTGAMIIAITVGLAISTMSPMRTLFIIPGAGALFGAVFMFLAVYISDHTPFGHPFADLIAFTVWQTGVASVCPACLGWSEAEIATE